MGVRAGMVGVVNCIRIYMYVRELHAHVQVTHMHIKVTMPYVATNFNPQAMESQECQSCVWDKNECHINRKYL